MSRPRARKKCSDTITLHHYTYIGTIIVPCLVQNMLFVLYMSFSSELPSFVFLLYVSWTPFGINELLYQVIHFNYNIVCDR